MATINGSGRNNSLNGTADGDDIYGNNGADTVRAGNGDDTIYGGTGNDSLLGENGNDLVFGEAGADRLFGGAGDDSLYGGDANDSIDGGDGNDLLNGGAGTDTLIGGRGIDTADYSDSGSAVTVNLTTGSATGSAIGTDTLSEIENVQGSAFGDMLTGNAADNLMDAGAGADTVVAGAGDDTVLGGAGNDSISAGVDAAPAPVPLDFNWSLAGPDEANIAGGVTQDTGGIQVDVSFVNDGAATEFSIESSTSVYVAPGETFNPNSTLYLYGQGGNQTSTATVDFSAVAGSGYADEVVDVSFRLADVDRVNGSWEDQITIRAYDADGNEIQVILTPSGSDGVSGNTIIAAEGNNAATDAQGSVLVTIPGPVARIVIDYDNGFTNGQLVQITDIQFSAVATDDDVVDAGDGDDTITTGLGDDSIAGGAGNDLIDAGAGNDTINFGEGNDIVYGGDGNDLIDDMPGVNLGGVNLVDAGAGNDTVWTGAGNDTIFGGAGIDVLSGEGDADLIFGGDDADQISGGDGADTLHGDAGNDTLSGDAGADLLFGGAGADALFGGAGNDLLDGGDGPDFLDGGADADTILGGIGDTVTGGAAGTDEDVLDLTAWGKAQTNIIFDPANPENGLVEFLDANGAVIGTMTFTDIETVVPCFTPGTMILTPHGACPVEELKVGDLVLTRDNGLQPVRWIGRRTLSIAELVMRPALRPIRLKAEALGQNQPNREMLVSPQHRMLIEGTRPEMLFGEREVLVAATHLRGIAGIDQVLTGGITYIHIMFDQHEIVHSDGCWSESFQPGASVLAGMRDEQRDEVLDLFPELSDDPRSYRAARPSLKRHEAKVLMTL